MSNPKKCFSENDLTYDTQLARGIRFSGESKDYFLEARWNDLYQCLPLGFKPGRILAAERVKRAWVFILNPAAHLVMDHIPFDRAAKMVSSWELQQLILKVGFSKVIDLRFLFYFPRFLKVLCFLEPLIIRVPLGAQYHLICQK